MTERQPLLNGDGRPSYSSSHSSDHAHSPPSESSRFHCHDGNDRNEHDDKSAKAKRILWISVLICLFFMCCEVVGGYLAQSLAIVTDAAHLLTDFASMLISLFSLYIAGRPPSKRMSFGFHRAEVLGAFFSVFLIWVVTAILVYLAVQRIISGEYEIDATIMAVTASLGVLVNLIMGALLYFGGHTHSHGGSSHGHSHGGHAHSSHAHSAEEGEGHDATNINVRAAFIHVLGDLIQSVGVLIAAIVIFFQPSWGIVDPICTLIFSVIVLTTTIYILRDAMVVLLEGRPTHIDFTEVFSSLGEIEGVAKVHDLRIWALTMDKVALSVHLEIEDEAGAQRILKQTREMLKRKYNVHESTVQIEGFVPGRGDCGGCEVPK